MNKIFSFKTLLFSLSVLLLVSCDKDFNEIGSDIIGNDHFNLDSLEIDVVAYNRRFGAVQSNNLPINKLGIYNDPVFGTTKASFVTQLQLALEDPTIGENPQVTKVELAVPYFSHVFTTNDDGSHTYELDDTYGAGNIKLDLFESTYFLRDLDPATNFQEQQAYYSDQVFSVGERLNDSIAAETDEFFFDDDEIVVYKLDDDGQPVVDTRRKPELNLGLDRGFFQEKLFGPAAAGKLVNNNTFKEWFRGLHFEVDYAASNPNGGTLAQMNFQLGTVTVTYNQGPTSARVTKTMVLNMTGNTVNVFENTENPTYSNGIANPNDVTGDEKLFLKGGSGSGAVLELFGEDDPDPTDGNDIPEALEELRAQNILVNDATLTFHIDQLTMELSDEPYRVYLYDLDNKQPLLDYFSDVSIAGDVKKSKTVHGGIIDTMSNGRGNTYKVRITNHIRNLLDPDADAANVRLGLVVTENIGVVGSGKLKNHQTPEVATDWVPYASVMNPLGTVLFGNTPSVPENKKMKLKVYFTRIHSPEN
jgi:hypothetical protein